MVVRVDEEDFRFLVLRAAVVDCLVVVAFYADTIGVVCVCGYFVDVVVVLDILSGDMLEPILEVVFIS